VLLAIATSGPDALRRAGDWAQTTASRSRLVGAALVGLVALELLFVALLAARESPLVSVSRRGYPDWMAGPLSGPGGLLPAGRPFLKLTLVVVVLGMCLAYAILLAGARAVPGRWATAAVVAAHVVLLLGPPLPWSRRWP
jgi:hypothetical protein